MNYNKHDCNMEDNYDEPVYVKKHSWFARESKNNDISYDTKNCGKNLTYSNMPNNTSSCNTTNNYKVNSINSGNQKAEVNSKALFWIIFLLFIAPSILISLLGTIIGVVDSLSEGIEQVPEIYSQDLEKTYNYKEMTVEDVLKLSQKDNYTFSDFKDYELADYQYVDLDNDGEDDLLSDTYTISHKMMAVIVFYSLPDFDVQSVTVGKYFGYDENDELIYETVDIKDPTLSDFLNE